VHFFASPRFTAASASITLAFFAMFGSIFFLTQYLQFVLGYTALQAGVRLVPMALVMLVLAPLAGQAVKAVGTKAMVAGGLAVGAAGLWYLALTGTSSGYPHVLVGLLLLGAGLIVMMVPATDSIMGSLPLGQAGVGSAMNDTTREIGGALGVAILGSVLSSRYEPAIGRALAKGFPAAVVAAAKSSVGAAVGAGQATIAQGHAAAGHKIIATADSTFIHSMDSALKIGAVIAFVGALVSAVWLPNRPPSLVEADLAVEEVDVEPAMTTLGPEAAPA
jgi:hypothetical protein